MSRPNSSGSKRPSKPYPEFPLFPHATGRWAKKIRGKLHYFGRWDEPEAALAKYMASRDALHAGVTPVDTQALTVFLLCAKFLTTKKRMMESDELSIHSFRDYARTHDRRLPPGQFQGPTRRRPAGRDQ